jgi:pimeloyl-ACP methyl ester carboxylesterase
MPKKTIRQTEPSPPTTASDPMAEAKRRIAVARRQNATELDLSDLGLTEVPAALGELRQLKRLFLDKNQLREVPTKLGALRQLQELRLANNQLREVPAALGELRQLEYLFLGNNQLREVPASLGELRKLKFLTLGGNRLRKVPAVLGELQQLLTLPGPRDPAEPITCQQLGQIRAPVTITEGALTAPGRRIMDAAAHRCIPQSQLITIPNARHGAPRENPSAFNEALLAFLART